MAAGFETTSHAITWCLTMLVSHSVSLAGIPGQHPSVASRNPVRLEGSHTRHQTRDKLLLAGACHVRAGQRSCVGR
jgi:cytochrome P450